MLRFAGLTSSAAPTPPPTQKQTIPKSFFFLFFTVSYGARRNLNGKIKNYYSVSFVFGWGGVGEAELVSPAIRHIDNSDIFHVQ